jgi:hypothetical protein
MDTQQNDAPSVPQNDAPSVDQSILGGLRQARQKIGAGADPLDIPVPGYDGQLVIRYRWVPMEQLASTARSLVKIDNPTKQHIAAAADAHNQCCDEVLVRVNGELKPLSTNEFPITFADGERLAFALGFQKPATARECVQAVFNNDYALVDTAFKVMSWLEDTSRKVSEEQLGE